MAGDWSNSQGIARGYRCRGIYVLILCTDDWPPEAFRRAGEGYVHDYIYKQMFGRESNFRDGNTCCGGFAIMKGTIKHSSIWLNKQASTRTGQSWQTDDSKYKYLCDEEKLLVNLAIEGWKQKGPNTIVPIPTEIDTVFKLGSLMI
mmetsp:Transcript_16335/g.23714  ORF Transcript_16335/g.23714 Transcript_16335/m.23714 type:complete len:146 (+) Transcript_16335:3-440(+)